MATIVRREVRKRGIVGWFFLLVFLAWNALMLLAMIAGLGSIGDSMDASAMPEATAAGATIGVGILLIIWAAGALITGLLALLTRGSKVIVEEVGR